MKNTETWKALPDYEGQYEVSDLGRVRSLDRMVNYQKTDKQKAFSKFAKGRLLKAGTMNKFGHVSVALGRGNSRCVHDLVLRTFVGPRPHKHDCLHINGVGSDNRLVNLRYGTRRENNLDMCAHGKRKLSPEDVKAIRCMPFTGRHAAKKFGMTETCISKIRLRKAYAQI